VVSAVSLARFFFPAEAKVAMHIAQADIIPEVGGVSAASTSGKLKEVDLNETPVIQNKRLRSRADALMKTGVKPFAYLSISLSRHNLCLQTVNCL
jgi:hypothetical protein